MQRGSGDLYAELFDYDIITLQPPYKPERYVEAIRAGEEAGYDTIIIDSLSPAWSDEGGILRRTSSESPPRIHSPSGPTSRRSTACSSARC